MPMRPDQEFHDQPFQNFCKFYAPNRMTKRNKKNLFLKTQYIQLPAGKAIFVFIVA
jgi:hypothetical protein